MKAGHAHQVLSIAALIVCAFTWVSCDRYERVRQLRSYADMQSIVAAVEQVRTSTAMPPTESEAEAILGRFAEGKDAWGNPFVYRRKLTAGGASYIVVSLGSDGRADVSGFEGYFSMPESMIQGEPEKDIVFRDGLPVANAGK